MTGWVGTLATERGFGFVRGEDRVTYFLHASSFAKGSYSDLKVGDCIEFEPVNGHTKVKIALDYDPPGGMAGEIGDKLVQATPGRVENDLKRFKEFIEHRPAPTGTWSGEIHSGQVVKN